MCHKWAYCVPGTELNTFQKSSPFLSQPKEYTYVPTLKNAIWLETIKNVTIYLTNSWRIYQRSGPHPPTLPHLHLECKETVNSRQALAVLSPRILKARSKPQLDNQPLHGLRRISGFLLHSITDRMGCWAANRAQGSCSPSTFLFVCSRASPDRARVFGEGRALVEAGLDTPSSSPTVDAGLRVSKRGNPPPRWTSLSPGPGNPGFFLSHLLESVPGRALTSEAAQARVWGLRCPCRKGAVRSPPRCRCSGAARPGAGPWDLPFKPSHRPHAVLPAAAASRSNEQLRRPSSRQRPNLQVAGSGSSKPPRKRNPSPSSPAPPSHVWLAGCRYLPSAAPWWNSGETARKIRREFSAWMRAASLQSLTLGGRQRIWGESDQSCSVLNGVRQRNLTKASV